MAFSIRRYSPHIAHTDTICVKYTEFFPSIFSFIWLWFFLSQRFPYFVCFIWLEHDFKYLGTYIIYNYTHWHRLIRLLSVCILFSPYHECRCHQIYKAKDRERKDTEKDKNNTQRQYWNKNEESSKRPKKNHNQEQPCVKYIHSYTQSHKMRDAFNKMPMLKTKRSHIIQYRYH